MVWSTDASGGGAGGEGHGSDEGGYLLPDERGVGQACVENEHCSGTLLCLDDLLGASTSCSQGCDDDSQCPAGTECARDVFNDAFNTVGGYCQRPCADDSDCEAYGSICASNKGHEYCY